MDTKEMTTSDGLQQRMMLDVKQVATMLSCSPRTVYRLADYGRMPRPVKLGALVRWPKAVLDKWIADGCPSCRRR